MVRAAAAQRKQQQADAPAGVPPKPKMDKPFTALKTKVVADIKELFVGRGLQLVQLVALLAFLSFRQWSIYVDETQQISCTADQPLFTRAEGLFDASEREALLTTAIGHPLSHAHVMEDELSANFANTRGFVLKFNREGHEQLVNNESIADLRFLLPFFDRVQDPEANSFVMNVVILAPDANASANAKPAIGLHVDDTVGIESARMWLAHSVSVLYLSIPVGMVGGALELYTDHDNKRPDARILPNAGELVVFRGDAYHRVTEMKIRSSQVEDDDEKEEPPSAGPDAGELRVSLVLEQYRIPPEVYPSTTVFTLNQQLDHRSYKYKAKLGLSIFRYISATAVWILVILSVFLIAYDYVGKLRR